MVGFGTSSAKKTSKRVVVGVGDMSISNTKNVILSTFALGSCVGIVAYDPVSGVAGLLHVMLPSSSVAAEKSKRQPFLFADSGVEKFVSMLKTMGADLRHLRCVIAGGASVMSSSDTFKIGEKNAIAVKQKLSASGIRVSSEYLGGFTNRSLHLDVMEETLLIVLPNEEMEVSLK